MTSERIKPISGPAPHTTDWYELRIFDPDRDRKVVWGASQTANVCGQGPYGSALEEFCRAKGVVERNEDDETRKERMRVGQLIEPAILQIYAEKTGCSVTTQHPMYFHPEHDFMGATPDAIRVVGASRQDDWVLCVDAKSTNWRMFDRSGQDVDKFGKEGTDQVPRYILFQAQQLMAVLGLGQVDFAVFCDGMVKIYSVDRSDELISQIVSAESEMVERLINDDPPEPAWTHSGTRSLINDMYGVSVGKTITLEPFEVDLFARCLEMESQKKSLESSITEIRNRILYAMGDAEVALCGDLKLKRSVIPESLGSEDHVATARSNIGKVIRKGSVRLTKSRRKDTDG